MKRHISLTKSTGNPEVDRAMDELRRKINPVLSDIGNNVDTLLSDRKHHVGEIIASVLSSAQFISRYGTEWALADGSTVSASSGYYAVSGTTTLPNLSAHIAGINYFIKVN